MRLGLCPNRHTPLVELIDNPVLDWVKELQVYSYSVDLDESPEAGPNTWNALKDAGLWQHLKTRGVKLSVEAGALKEYDCQGEKHLEELDRMHAKLENQLWAVAIDEPLVAGCNSPRNYWGKTCYERDKLHEVSQVAAKYIKRAHSYGVRAHLIEAYPDPHDWLGTMKTYLEMVCEIDKPDRFVIDLNWTGVDNNAPKRAWWQKLFGLQADRADYDARVADDLREMKVFCREQWIELGLIIGSPHIARNGMTQGGFVQSSREQKQRFPVTPYATMVQSWEHEPDMGWPDLATLEQIAWETKQEAGG